MHRTTLLQNCPELIDKVDYLLREEWPSSNAVIKVTRDVRKFPVRVVCVTSRGELVGHVKTIEETKDTIKLCSLVVKKEYRNRGIGRELVECAERETVRRGYNSICLRTSEELASSFYRSAGYRIERKRNNKVDADPTDKRIRDLKDLISVAKENSFKHARVVSNMNESTVQSRVRSGIPMLLAYLADTSNTNFRPVVIMPREDDSTWCVHFGIIVGIARDSKGNLLTILQHLSSRKRILIPWSEIMCSNASVDRAAHTSALSSRALLLN